MTHHQAHNQIAPPRNGAVAPAAAWAEWVQRHWGAVRVIGLDVTRLADIVDRVRVRAVIHLGSLSPADVHVGAVCGAPESVAGSEQPTSELYSAQSYRNGAFVFEGFTAAEAPDGHGTLTVLVRPRGTHENLSGLCVVARPPEDLASRAGGATPADSRPGGA